MWFKANTPELRHEGPWSSGSPARVPDRVPPLLAGDVERGWMLMADAGDRLREVVAEERSLARWHDVLAGAADVALALEPDVDGLVAAGVPDLRLAPWRTATPSWYSAIEVEQRFRDAVGSGPRAGRGARVVRRDGDAPARRPPRRAGLREGRPQPDPRLGGRGDLAPVLHDVGDAGGRRRVGSGRRGADSVDIWPYVDSYLARYAPDRPELRDAVPPALRLGWACRALNNPEVSGESTPEPAADVPRRPARVARLATRRAWA